MKAILVIEVDDNTDFETARATVHMPFHTEVSSTTILYPNVKLKPLPEKRGYVEVNMKEMELMMNMQVDGWNRCIDEILGESND